MRTARWLLLTLPLLGCISGPYRGRPIADRFAPSDSTAYVLAVNEVNDQRVVRVYCGRRIVATLPFAGRGEARAEVQACEQMWFVLFYNVDDAMAFSEAFVLEAGKELQIGIARGQTYYQIADERWPG